MDVNQLRHELTQGIRLPNPEFCPGQIADVIQRCFFENPNDRPDFKEIKSLIEAAYIFLMETRAQTNKDMIKSEEKVELLYQNAVTLQVPKDDKMKERYLDMRRGNKKIQNNDSFGKDPSAPEDVQHATTFVVSSFSMQIWKPFCHWQSTIKTTTMVISCYRIILFSSYIYLTFIN